MGQEELDETISEIRVGDVMTHPVITALPSETIVSVARKMAENDIGSIVVIDSKGIVVGIVTEADIVRRVVAPARDPRKTLVEEIMTRNPVVVREDTPLHRAVSIMVSRGIGHLPVVDEAGRPIGIVARSDIAKLAPGLLEKASLMI
ncbi:MAG: CBS domain-containing protein [Pyrodictiaceae archaeon]